MKRLVIVLTLFLVVMIGLLVAYGCEESQSAPAAVEVDIDRSKPRPPLKNTQPKHNKPRSK